jgi:hypothetical protein
VWLEGLGQLKNPNASSGIEPATFRPVAYALTNYATACLHSATDIMKLPFRYDSPMNAHRFPTVTMIDVSVRFCAYEEVFFIIGGVGLSP